MQLEKLAPSLLHVEDYYAHLLLIEHMHVITCMCFFGGEGFAPIIYSYAIFIFLALQSVRFRSEFRERLATFEPGLKFKNSPSGIPPPTNVKAVQDGLTSIIVSWTLSSNATGYRIYYDSSGGHGGFEDVTNGSTDSYTLEGLQTETHYTIMIMATSEDHPPSTLVELNIYLSKNAIIVFLLMCMLILLGFC